MTALVTGGTGFVGAHVVRALLERGAGRVRCLARPASGPLEPRRPRRRPGAGRSPRSGESRGGLPGVRRGLPLRGRLPAVRPRPLRDPRLEHGRDAQSAGGRAEGRSSPDRLHELGGGARAGTRRRAGRRDDARRAGEDRRPLQAQQVRRGAGGRAGGCRGRAGGHREPVDAGRRAGVRRHRRPAGADRRVGYRTPGGPGGRRGVRGPCPPGPVPARRLDRHCRRAVARAEGGRPDRRHQRHVRGRETPGAPGLPSRWTGISPPPPSPQAAPKQSSSRRRRRS